MGNSKITLSNRDLEFYNYIFVDPRKPGKYIYSGLPISFLYEPFYVGKGKNNRWKHHIYDYSNNYKTKLIKKLKDQFNYSILDYVIILNHNPLNANVILFEKLLIEKIGRYVNNSGPLTNITEGGDGQSSDYMKKNNPMFKISSEEHSDKVKATQWSGEIGEKRKQNMSNNIGDKNPASKKFQLIFADGTTIEFIGLKNFCKVNNYSYNLLFNWINKGKIIKTNKKDTSFYTFASKRKLEGCEIRRVES